MVKQKGTIIKLKNNLAIIMTNDCRIVSIMRQPGMYEGLEISFNKNEIINRKSKLVFSSRIAAGVAAIFIIMFVSFNLFYNYGAYAYVAIDSDTSIEFELDKNNKILKVNCYNDDANALLNELDFKNKSIDFAIKKVIEKLNLNESTILISACLKEQNSKKSVAPANNESENFSKLIDICKSVVEDNVSGGIDSKVVEVPYDYKKLADKNKISLGRSIVYEKAKEQGIDFDIEEIKAKSIGETLKQVKIDDAGIVHNVKKAEPKNPDQEPKIKEPPKDKPISEEKKDPKPEVKPIDGQQEKPKPEPKAKPEEKPAVAPKDSLGEKPAPKPKDGEKEEPKNKAEVKPEVEPKHTPEEKPKDKLEGKPDIEPKNAPKEKPKYELKNMPEAGLKDGPKETQKDNPESLPKPDNKL
ncbi:MAG TPA: anti-sigma factor domain-containing protein [Acetivibrio sp.]|uniref:anti-sigma-I factor RsgI family protein n=1 Tax=Acetivibrio sp. TaxID=1872092 RepID=UPI002CA52A0E|nr:anti-sigma factor domain-containing protein [Acetivibrio sp.]HOM02342.1 anti-sigma factor domain-containing protein [Acetivibrio sp.]